MTRDARTCLEVILSTLPSDIPRVAIIGSTSFHHTESPHLCHALAFRLAAMPEVVLLTGGVDGVGEMTARVFAEERARHRLPPNLFHILPEGDKPRDTGVTLHAGRDMSQRRVVLGLIAGTYIMIEGGPGTRHEAEIALGNRALVVPIARSGGEALRLFMTHPAPLRTDTELWERLASTDADFDSIADACVRLCGLPA